MFASMMGHAIPETMLTTSLKACGRLLIMKVTGEQSGQQILGSNNNTTMMQVQKFFIG